MLFRKALPSEASILTKLTLDSKRYWGYPEELISLWKAGLTVTPDYINKNIVIVAEEAKEISGYISIVEEPSDYLIEVESYKISGGFFLDNIFIHPAHIRRGIGEKLIAIAFEWCKENQIKQLFVISDPNAKGFYEKTGAVYLGEKASTPPGRTLPLLVYNL